MASHPWYWALLPNLPGPVCMCACSWGWGGAFHLQAQPATPIRSQVDSKAAHPLLGTLFPLPQSQMAPRLLSCACIFIGLGEGFEMSTLFFGGGAVL